MSKYLWIGAAGFFMGMKYCRLGRRRCVRLMKNAMHRFFP